MGLSLEARFERYCDTMVATMMHADREQPGRWYLTGLVLPGGRKSVEPMAARVQSEPVRSAHQSVHHLVAEAQRSDEAMLAAVAKEVLPKLVQPTAPVFWILDDTGFPKKGRRAAGKLGCRARSALRPSRNWPGSRSRRAGVRAFGRLTAPISSFRFPIFR